MSRQLAPHETETVFGSYSVQDVVRAKARVIATTKTRSGLVVTLWDRRGGGKIAFEPDHHTFSLYLAGGRQVRPVEGERPGHATGSPGAICVMPKGLDTAWDNRGYVRLAHVYFHPGHLAHATDGRMLDLPAATFARDPLTQSLMERFVLALDWSDSASSMALEHGVFALLARFALQGRELQESIHRGGLTNAQRRRTREIVEARLGERITVTELAEANGLSVRQFSRAFVQSEGVPPYEWVLSRRVEAARTMLRRGEHAATVAAECGFNSQSHMARHFKARLGITPSRVRVIT